MLNGKKLITRMALATEKGMQVPGVTCHLIYPLPRPLPPQLTHPFTATATTAVAATLTPILHLGKEGSFIPGLPHEFANEEMSGAIQVRLY